MEHTATARCWMVANSSWVVGGEFHLQYTNAMNVTTFSCDPLSENVNSHASTIGGTGC